MSYVVDACSRWRQAWRVPASYHPETENSQKTPRDLELGEKLPVSQAPGSQRPPVTPNLTVPEIRGPQRAPSSREISDAINRTFSVDESEQDDLNDLTGERPHIVLDEPPSDSSTAVEEPKTWLPSQNAWKVYFMQEVAGDRYLEMQLLLMTIVTGALDAMTYTTYRVFTTKQTGNALFLALYAFRNPAISERTEQNVAVSMATFFVGALFWGQLGRVSRQRRRIWLVASQLFQAFSILAATAVRYWASRKSTGPGALGILTLLSFAMSGQIATALNVNMPELNTTMITGALIALASDKDLFRWKNSKRMRRILFFASIEAGSFIGAAMLNFRSPTSTILVCAALKFLIVGTFLFNKGIVKQPRQVRDGRTLKTDGTATPVSRILWGD